MRMSVALRYIAAMPCGYKATRMLYYRYSTYKEVSESMLTDPSAQ